MIRLSPSSPSTFTHLLVVAFVVSLLGLGANLMHLGHLTLIPSDDSAFYTPFHHHHHQGRSLRQSTNEEGVSESIVFGRLLKESVAVLDQCHATVAGSDEIDSKQASSVSSSSLSSQSNSQPSLSRFGFMNALNNHLSSVLPSSSNSRNQCTIPSSTSACQVSSYTMLVTFFEHINLRILFLNLMSWITHSSAQQVIVLLPLSVNETIQNDLKYGHRILTWHADESHKVVLEFVMDDSIWTVNYTRLLPQNEALAVVWKDGGLPDTGNHRGLQSGLELWKRHSANGVVASRTVPIILKNHQKHQATNYSTTVPFCPTAKISVQQQENDNNHNHEQPSPFHYLSKLDGMFHHASFLCFLSHNVLKSLHRYTASSYEDQQWAIALLLQHLSGTRKTLLYPSTIARDEKTTAKRRRRLSASPLLQVQQQQLKQPLFGTTTNKNKDMSTVITAVSGFLGSLPPVTESFFSTETTQLQLPWMTEKCI